MPVATRDVGQRSHPRKIIGIHHGSDVLVRKANHGAIENLAEFFVGIEHVGKNRFAVYMLPAGLTSLNAVHGVTDVSPVRLFTTEHNKVSCAVRGLAPKGLARR